MEPWAFGAIASGEALPQSGLEIPCDLLGAASDRRFARPRAKVMVGFDPKHIALAGAPQRLLDIADPIDRISRDQENGTSAAIVRGSSAPPAPALWRTPSSQGHE